MGAEDDKNAKQLVLDILKHKSIGKLKVTIDKITISPKLYEAVRKAIDEGKIAVIVQPDGLKANEAAKYFGTMKFSEDMIFYDVIVLRSAALTGNKAQDLLVAQAIVHECTHAGFDLLKQKMTGLQNEALAYIAGAMFLQGPHGRAWRRSEEN
jgi:predicted metal-dependent TIM-barrel fold hydrolase